MALSAHFLASGTGWRVYDVICTFGPGDRPFEERHAAVSIAAVTAGTFRYRSTRGTALLAPGALLLGNYGDAFECSHEHCTGDRCLSFQFAPDFVERFLAEIPGARRMAFAAPRLPPQPQLLPIVAAAEAARDDGDAAGLEEAALRLAGRVFAGAAAANGAARAPSLRTPSRSDERRISAAVRLIEAQAHEPLALSDLASAAAMSPYHFLRTFRAVVGMTPHQFVLHTRLRRAAVRLRATRDDIATIAFAAGFNDLSTFNRRFARIMGASPRAYRAASRSA
jgi:AraC family transcriptional regulator